MNEHPVIDTPIPPTISKDSRKLLIGIFLFLIGVVCIAIVALVIFTLSRPKNTENVITNSSNTAEEQSNTSNNTDNDTDLEEEESPTTKVFTGNYIQATIPFDWNIREYDDESGMEAFISGGNAEFDGLTGLEIRNAKDQVVFRLQGIDGVGGAGGCSEVGQFNDTELSYIQTIQADNESLEFEPAVVIDLKNTEYSPIFTLGLRFRRVENKLYLAIEENPTVFNTACGINAQFVRITELGFSVEDDLGSYRIDAYSFELNSDITDNTELVKLGGVLNTLKKI